MTDLQAIQESREHWKRMIAQAEKFIKAGNTGSSSGCAMACEIEETWTARYCDLCAQYVKMKCVNYPLNLVNEKCSPSGAWDRVDTSRSWHEWKSNAEKYMLPALDRAESFCRDRGDKE